MPEQPQSAVNFAKKLRDELEGKSPAERLHVIMLEIADEADAIKDARDTLEDPTVASARRVVALKEMGNLILQLDKLGAEIDLSHPILQVLCTYLLDTIVKVMKIQGMPQAQVEVYLSALYREIQGWEKEVETRYKIYRREQLVVESQEKEQRTEKKEQGKLQEKQAQLVA